MLHLTIFHSGNGKSTPITVADNCTVGDLFAKVEQIVDTPGGDYSLLCGSTDLKQFDNSRRVQDCGIKNHGMLCIVYRVRGGTLTNLQGWVTKSTDSCIIYGDTPDDGEYHAKIRCGHTISVEAMRRLVFNAKVGQRDMKCPDVSCNAVWPFYVVNHVANFAADELKEIMKKGASVRECPNCTAFCRRENPNNPRVICTVCTHQNNGRLYEFCWYCLTSWKGSGTSCDNKTCADARTGLTNCKNKYVVGVSCPSIRACPNKDCFTLIEHREACKQMACPKCSTEFCFICLKEKSGDRWQCGSWNSQCTPAPKQKLL